MAVDIAIQTDAIKCRGNFIYCMKNDSVYVCGNSIKKIRRIRCDLIIIKICRSNKSHKFCQCVIFILFLHDSLIAVPI